MGVGSQFHVHDCIYIIYSQQLQTEWNVVWGDEFLGGFKAVVYFHIMKQWQRLRASPKGSKYWMIHLVI